MITPKEKAKKLIKSFTANAHGQVGSETLFANSRKCALKCVNEILKIVVAEYNFDRGGREWDKFLTETILFWKQVKDEILNQTFV